MISNKECTQQKMNAPLPIQDMNAEDKTKKFVKKHQRDLTALERLTIMNETKAFMLKRPYLACEETANYLVIRCFILEMEKQHDVMKKVAHQYKCIQSILELAKQNDADPKSFISIFFTKIQNAQPEYKNAFECELIAFMNSVTKKAEEAVRKQLEEAKGERER